MAVFDLSKEFNDFYNNHTVLPIDVKNDLRDKKNLNIDRLKSGLLENNQENDTDYTISEIKEQGSIAMSTIVQNDNHDYDIDVAIVFDEENIGKETGMVKSKNIVVNALKRKCTNFKKEPEALTNCVRIEYADGYHVDFAVYKKSEDTYYHAGSSWQERNPNAINQWFNDSIKEKGDKLRKIIRLSKMFCKSRKSWRMPGGLIQTVLCEECLSEHERIDECFYYTMKAIVDRLEESSEIYNPVDQTKSLLLKQKDKDEVNNWKRRLNDKLSKMDIVLKSECTKKQAFDSWYSFFNHSFWQYTEEPLAEANHANIIKSFNVTDKEEFIFEKYPVDINYSLDIDCRVEANGFREKLLSTILKSRMWIPHNRKLTFYIVDTNVPKPYEVLWKVKNVGLEAIKRDQVRGQIIKSNLSNNMRKECTSFWGPHFVECYIIKDGFCVASSKINVPIDK